MNKYIQYLLYGLVSIFFVVGAISIIWLILTFVSVPPEVAELRREAWIAASVFTLIFSVGSGVVIGAYYLVGDEEWI